MQFPASAINLNASRCGTVGIYPLEDIDVSDASVIIVIPASAATSSAQDFRVLGLDGIAPFL